jgi:hypothetical protein
MQSLRIAIENPPRPGEYRVFNQFDAYYSVNELAELTHRVAKEFGLSPTIDHPANPRVETEQHYYNPLHDNLVGLGYRRTRALEDVVREIFHDLIRYRRRLEARKHVVMPTVQWRSGDSRPALDARVPPPRVAPPAGPTEPSAEGPTA